MDSRSVMPPMSTTSLPSSSEPVSAPAPSIKAPILASDILRDEVAPLTPARSAMRRWLLVLSAAFGLLAAASFGGLLPAAPLAVSAALVTAGAAALAWPRPVPYGARAGLATLAGLLPLVLGAQGKGPLALIGSSHGYAEPGAALVLVTLLPAALFFRAQYRAFRAARGFLVFALLLAAPAVYFLGQSALAGDTGVAVRVADVVSVMAVMASFAGFLGPETTGACTILGRHLAPGAARATARGVGSLARGRLADGVGGGDGRGRGAGRDGGEHRSLSAPSPPRSRGARGWSMSTASSGRAPKTRRMLPPLPRIHLRVARDRSLESRATGGFLDVHRLDLVAQSPGGTDSRPFAYDVATRASLDAVVMAAHHVRDGVRRVFLRSALRPPLALRPIAPASDGALWELPAGLIDPGELPHEAAARELAEELGFTVEPGALLDLGPPTFPAPGFIAEMHHFFHVEVDPASRRTPSEDGSVLERDAVITDAPLAELLDDCRSGRIPDAKTELALRRLAEQMPRHVRGSRRGVVKTSCGAPTSSSCRSGPRTARSSWTKRTTTSRASSRAAIPP